MLFMNLFDNVYLSQFQKSKWKLKRLQIEDKNDFF